MISTPDHWHALIAMDAVAAGKDVYLQKPASLTIAEGRALSDAVRTSGRIFQIGSQQRSTPQFRYAAELVRNGRIGQLKTVEVGLPGDPSGDDEPEMPVPANLNYDMWLGSTPVVPYTEKRVHPQTGYGRPGWLRCEQFGAGMITGWGAHHIDSAHWGMGTELTGPVEIWGTAEFPTKGLWDVHGPFKTEALYADGVRMTVSGDFPNGIKFIGTDGWIFVSRGNETVTASDPVARLKDPQALAASDPKIITSVIGPDEIHLTESTEHIATGSSRSSRARQPIAPVEVAHRACSACLLHHMAMKLKRRLHWDPRAGAVQQRRRGERDAVASAARALRLRRLLAPRERAPLGNKRLARVGRIGPAIVRDGGAQPGRPGPGRTDTARARDTARRTARALSRSSFTPRPGPSGTRIAPFSYLNLPALDDVVGQVVIVRIGREGQVRHDRAQVQHRRELDAELAGRVHRDAELKRLADAGRLHARADAAPERRVEQDDVDRAIQHVGRELLEVDDDGVGRERDAELLARAPHARQAEDGIFEVVVVQILDRAAEADRLLGRPDRVGIEADAIAGQRRGHARGSTRARSPAGTRRPSACAT